MFSNISTVFLDLQQQISAINLDSILNKLNNHDAMFNNQKSSIDGIKTIRTIKFFFFLSFNKFFIFEK